MRGGRRALLKSEVLMCVLGVFSGSLTEREKVKLYTLYHAFQKIAVQPDVRHVYIFRSSCMCVRCLIMTVGAAFRIALRKQTID